MTDKTAKTYVLVGHDPQGVFSGLADALKKRGAEKGDVELIYPDPNKTMGELMKSIKAPANVILAAHGLQDGRFEWGRGQMLPYSIMLHALPRQGVESVTITSCYGGMAHDSQLEKSLPAGTILQSLVGNTVPSWKVAINRLGVELAQLPQIRPLNLLLKALDNTDPAVSLKLASEENARLKSTNPFAVLEPNAGLFIFKAQDVLPHTIAIGGRPPIELDLDREMANVSGRGRAGGQAQVNFNQAVALVKAHFDTEAGIGKGSEPALRRRIDDVAQRLTHNADIADFTVGEKRIAYAIALANLSTSGEMQQLIIKAKDSENTLPSRPRIVTNWDGKGSETIAKLQAILEIGVNIATDNGGARDGSVDGTRGPTTNQLLSQWQHDTKIKPQDDKNYEKLLQALLKEPYLKKMFATVKDANGQEVLDIVLRRDPPSGGRSGPER